MFTKYYKTFIHCLQDVFCNFYGSHNVILSSSSSSHPDGQNEIFIEFDSTELSLYAESFQMNIDSLWSLDSPSLTVEESHAISRSSYKQFSSGIVGKGKPRSMSVGFQPSCSSSQSRGHFRTVLLLGPLAPFGHWGRRNQTVWALRFSWHHSGTTWACCTWFNLTPLEIDPAKVTTRISNEV